MAAQNKTQRHKGTRSAGAHDTHRKGVLFTAFEPSGDSLASPVIAELRRRIPELPIYAWGGPRMREAGAQIIQETGASAEMGGVSIGKIIEHSKINRNIRSFVRSHWIGAHVAVDSPAANFPICKITRKLGCRVAHLAAPQVWAWASWRIGKLRRRTDKVLCLLPFEEAYFREHNVPATFIGHPILHDAINEKKIAEQVETLPHGSPKLAFLPGSRPKEVKGNLGPMIRMFSELKGLNQQTVGVIVAASESLAQMIRSQVRDMPVGLFVVAGRLQAVLKWAEVGILCSGTATLDATRFRLPMIVIYRLNPLSWYMVGKWLVKPDFFALPNLIAGREIVPEFVPYFGGVKPIVDELRDMLEDSRRLAEQKQALDRIASFFAGVDPGTIATDEILKLMDL